MTQELHSAELIEEDVPSEYLSAIQQLMVNIRNWKQENIQDQ